MSTVVKVFGIGDVRLESVMRTKAVVRWSADASRKRDDNNIAQMSPEELARRRREFDAQKEIARGIRESAA
jgi:hypothetical protein